MNNNLDTERNNRIITQFTSLRSEIDYTARDYAIDYLVEKFQAGVFFIPVEYQRNFIWDDKDKCRFIESVLLGYPIPFMFFSNDPESGNIEIVDGAQRTSTLEQFLNNDLVLTELKRLTEFNNCIFSQLPLNIQGKFRSTELRIILLREGTTIDVRQEIFNRINTSGQKATDTEIRRGAYPGKFMDFVKKCSENLLFIKLCPTSKTGKAHFEDNELIIRFFALLNNYKNFDHSVGEFFDDFVIQNRNEFDEELFKKEFVNMLKFVDENFDYGFRKTQNAKSVPRTRFEAISVGTALALRENASLTPAIPTKWADINSEDGKRFRFYTTTHASNTKSRVLGRIEYVKDMLLIGKERNENCI